MPGLVLFELVRKRSPWPVGELEESVVAWLLDLAARFDEPADELVMGPVISIQIHRSKLEHREGLHHLPNADLSEEDRTVRAQFHQGGNQQEKRRKYYKENQTADDVLPPLDRVVARPPLPARPSLRVEERIHEPKSLLPHKLWLGIDMESNRKLGDRLRTQPLGERSTDSS